MRFQVGHHHSEETKEKMRLSAKERGIRPPGFLGPHTPETKEKMRLIAKGSCRQIPSRLGIPNSEDQKAKISATLKLKGHKPPPSYGDDNASRRPEVRTKISAALKGRPLSQEHLQALLHRPKRTFGPVTRAKMSATHAQRVKDGLCYNWKGGITPLAMRIRHSPACKAWRKAIFERDDYTCQDCGQRGGRLNAHHIKAFATYPELRFSAPNGVTLCRTCHYTLRKRVEEPWKLEMVTFQTFGNMEVLLRKRAEAESYE